MKSETSLRHVCSVSAVSALDVYAALDVRVCAMVIYSCQFSLRFSMNDCYKHTVVVRELGCWQVQ